MKSKLNLTRGFVFLVCCLFTAGSLFAQGKTVQGTVTDASGPLVGVTVMVQGTTTGVTTGLDGSYSIRVSDNNANLEFSFVGYQPVVTAVGDRTVINVKMEDDAQALDEVVVIGYGTVRRRDLTGAVASVNSKNLNAAPVTNVAQALQGKLAGVNITAQDGRPDASISIRVRGGGSISQSNDPLVLIDGIPGSLNTIPGDMIASVDVLKDASSTAIYGARGANGVILVTTKKPQEGRVSVSYNGYVRFNEPTGYTDVMNPYEYLAFKWGLLETYREYGDPIPFQKLYGLGDYTSGTTLDGKSYNNQGGIDSYKNIPLYDLQREIYKSSITHNHDLTISGGTDKTKILFSVNYTDDQGMKLMSYTKRATASFKLDQKVFRNLDFNLDLRYIDRETFGNEGTSNGQGSILSSSYRFRPIAVENMLGDPLMIANGLFTGEDTSTMMDVWNPVQRIKDRENLQTAQTIRGTAGFNWTIIPGLVGRSELTLARTNTINKNWTGPTGNATYFTVTGTQTPEEMTVLFAGDADYRKRDNWSLRWSNTLNYNFTLGEIHRFNVMVGHEVTNSGGSDMRIQAYKFPGNYTKENAFAMIHQGDASLLNVSSAVNDPDRVLSFFGRANYTLMDRYLFTATFRADASAKFSPEHRWGYFPAAAVAWRISEEAFMKEASWIDDLKLRLSYGTVGNDAIEPGMWQQDWEAVTSTGLQYPIDNTPNPAYTLKSQMANKNLKWETTITRNIGIDYTLLKGRLWGSVDVYKNSTRDLLMLKDIPSITGFTTSFANIGKTSNKGIEIAVSGIVFQNKDWNITAGGNINFNKGNIDELAEGLQSGYGSSIFQSGIPNNDYRLQEGKPVGIIMGYKMDGKGFYTTDDFDYDSSTGRYTLKSGQTDISSAFVYNSGGITASGQQAYPGAPKFQNSNDDNVIDSQDIFEIGNTNPIHTGGFNVNVNYKNFDLGLYFNWSYGNDIYNANKLATLYNINKSGGLLGNKMAIVNDSYKYYEMVNGKPNRVTDPAALTALNKDATLPSTYLLQGYTSDLGIEDGSFLRLNTVSLGYTLPKKVLDKVGVKNLRVYGTVYNVFTLTGYSGLDPEVNTNTGQGSARYPTTGLDWGAYPRSRQFVIGLNVTF